jgi:hypothetical protein
MKLITIVNFTTEGSASLAPPRTSLRTKHSDVDRSTNSVDHRIEHWLRFQTAFSIIGLTNA